MWWLETYSHAVDIDECERNSISASTSALWIAAVFQLNREHWEDRIKRQFKHQMYSNEDVDIDSGRRDVTACVLLLISALSMNNMTV